MYIHCLYIHESDNAKYVYTTTPYALTTHTKVLDNCTK